MTEPPTGDVTFLFTDIVGSTALWDRQPEAMTDALAEHDDRIRGVVERHGGFVFTTAGDSFAVAFPSAAAGLAAAIDAQLAMSEPLNGLDLAVRIGVHSGSAMFRNDDYFGASVNLAARIESSAHAQQIVVSQATVDRLGADLPAGVELRDLGVHRLRGFTEPTHLHQVCHPELSSDHPRLRTAEGPDDALPVQLTSFVGRSREVAEVADLLRANRIVTLAGSGGAGKTRLSIRVAEQMVADFPDGLRMAELGAVVDADVLVEEVAQRFAISTVAGQSPAVTLAEGIGDQRVLLVLDNCEQIVRPVAELCRDLLTRCPSLAVLATSRQRLGVAGEVVYRVPSLALPEPEVGAGDAMGFDAVRLFVDRARLVDQTFELTDDNVADAVSICRHLDGIPLALELAAARLRSMSPAQIVQRLGQRFKLLTGADHTSIPRQETLLSAIEWSHDLLDDDERTLFRRLGVFAADFTLEAAEGTCAADDLDELDVLDLVTALVDKSMVATEQGADGETRYQLLESIREFAVRRLDEAGELDRLRERHAQHYAATAESLRAMQRSGDLAGALRGLDDDEAEFRSVLRFTTETRRDELAGRLAGGLGYLWYAAGLHREGFDWCRSILDVDPDLSDEVRAELLHGYAALASGVGRPELGVEAASEQVAIRRRLDQPERLGAALNNLGNNLVDVGDVDRAEPVFAEAVAVFDALGDDATLALVYCSMAWGHYVRGDLDAAVDAYGRGLTHARGGGNAMSIAVAMASLGQALAFRGEADAARPHLVEARERFVELNVGPGIQDTDMSLGLVALSEGRSSDAARHWMSALTSGVDGWYGEYDFWTLGNVASMIDDLPTAATLVGAAAEAFDTTRIAQPRCVLDALAATRARLEVSLGDEFGVYFRAGGRRSRAEAVEIGVAALDAFLAAESKDASRAG